MHIQINTDRNIHGREKFIEKVSSNLTIALAGVSSHITRIELHLRDENGEKGGTEDKRCMIEARMEGRRPVAVTSHAATVEGAIHDATAKLLRVIEDVLDRLDDSHRIVLDQSSGV